MDEDFKDVFGFLNETKKIFKDERLKFILFLAFFKGIEIGRYNQTFNFRFFIEKMKINVKV